MMAKPKDVHVDLLAIDMETGRHLLDPVDKNKDKLDEIRERNRAKWLAEGEADAGRRKKKDKGFDPNEPRDDAGRWTSGGGDAASSPAPSADEKLLLVSERPNDEKLDRWEQELNARSKEIEDQGQAGNKEDEHLGRMQTALNTYKQESEESLDAERSGLNTIYDGDGHLLAAAFTYIDDANKKAVIQHHGAVDRDAYAKLLDQVSKKFGEKVTSIQAEEWRDDPETIALFQKAGFVPVAHPTEGTAGGRVTLVKADIPGAKLFSAAHTGLILGAAKATAKLGGYDPDLVDASDEVHEFNIGGRSGYKAAGLAFLKTGRITVFPAQISTADAAVSVTTHEVAHQKYQTVLDAKAAEWKRIMLDPETIGPNGIRPDGTLPPGLAEKYPIYSRLVVHEGDALHKRIDEDGVSKYSEDYWKEVKPGGVSIEIAQHETIAEMARLSVDTGKLPGAKVWKDYYRDIMKSYDELHKAKT